MRSCKEFYEFQVRRNSTRLSRGLLTMLEDLQAQERINQAKLLAALPPEQRNCVAMSSILNDEQMKHLRKRVLDSTNDYAREMLSDLENFEFEFKFGKQG